MKEEVCNYKKFGFCKFKDLCKKKHLKETCEDLSACENSKSCHKRHPRGCKRHAVEGFCRFGLGCAYHHKEPPTTKNHLEINMKVEELERVVNKMADKIVHLEGKIKEMESKEREVIKIKEAAKSIEDPRKVPNKKDNPIGPKEKKSQPKDPKHKDSVFKFGAAARKTVFDQSEPTEKELLAKYFKFNLCDYKCEKRATLTLMLLRDRGTENGYMH